jgi:hypothetical protein
VARWCTWYAARAGQSLGLVARARLFELEARGYQGSKVRSGDYPELARVQEVIWKVYGVTGEELGLGRCLEQRWASASPRSEPRLAHGPQRKARQIKDRREEQ